MGIKNIRNILFLKLLVLLLFVMPIRLQGFVDEASLAPLPSLYKGRIRPLESYAKLWLSEYYHAEKILPQHLEFFKADSGTAQEFLWKLHFFGNRDFHQGPLFWISHAKIKESLALNFSQQRFSFAELSASLFSKKETNLQYLRPLILHAFQKIPSLPIRNKEVELKSLAPGLWVRFDRDQLLLLAAPKGPLWQFLSPGLIIHEQISSARPVDPLLVEEGLGLLRKLTHFSQIELSSVEQDLEMLIDKMSSMGKTAQEISAIFESHSSVSERISQSDSLFKILPGKGDSGEWLPLKALKLKVFDLNAQALKPISNFTLFEDAQFENIRETYLSLESAIRKQNSIQAADLSRQLAQHLSEGYASIAQKTYLKGHKQSLYYPSSVQLQAELFYSRYPLTEVLLAAYTISLFLLGVAYLFPKMGALQIWGMAGGLFAFILHSGLLILRSVILNRPPVSNMYETVIYVPWITVLTGMLLFYFTRRIAVITATIGAAATLLWILKFSQLSASLDNVQAVLNSQFWLTTHVLLVVGSYGIFALAAILGHLYLILDLYSKDVKSLLKSLSSCILQTLYCGTALLVIGTLLGGVWAAESWGRFWDWDPKESWAFISICTYLVGIHAFRYRYIHDFGLAIGAIIGWLSISFTWYGVNYILGTGLHSYGFGSGGERYYYFFFIGEILFLLAIGGIKQCKHAKDLRS